MTVQKYKKTYQKEPTLKLVSMKRSFEGQSGIDNKTQDRMNAIEEILAEREITKSKNKEQNYEALIARKFLNKLDNARKRELEFTLTLADVKRLMTRKTCYYTGRYMRDDVLDEHPDKRTFERLDNKKGYTKENTVACCNLVNQLKAVFLEGHSKLRMTRREIKKFADKL